MDLKEALQTALDFELRGEGIYKDVAETSKNPIVKKTFNYLFGQEQNHINEIKKFMEELNVGSVEFSGDDMDGVRGFFNGEIKQIKEKMELSGDDEKAHEQAMELEKYSYNFYKQRMEEASDEKVKNFFKTLMEQENAHYALIQNAYEYIKNPEQFFAEEEKWIVEG